MASTLDLDWAYKLAEIVVLGGGVVLAILRSGRLIQRFENIATQQTKEIGELKDDVKALNVLVTDMVKVNGRIDLLEQRLVLWETWFRDREAPRPPKRNKEDKGHDPLTER